MKKILLAFLLYRSTACLAQDPFFSQYNSNAIYLNPAFAGSFEKGIFTAAYRDQWPEFDKTYRTLNFSFNKYYSKVKGGLGVYYNFDNAGAGSIKTHNIQFMYAPHIQIKNALVIKPAVSFGFAYKSLAFDNLTFSQMVDPRYNYNYSTNTETPKNHVTYFDVSSGILIYNNFFSIGAAFNHLNTPDESFIETGSSPLPLRYTIHGRINFSIHVKGTFIGIQPSVVYIMHGASELTKIGFTLKYGWLLTGVYYQESVKNTILMAGFEKKKIRIGYSYDFAKIGWINVHTHEFFISYSLTNKKQKTEGMLFNNSFAF